MYDVTVLAWQHEGLARLLTTFQGVENFRMSFPPGDVQRALWSMQNLLHVDLDWTMREAMVGFEELHLSYDEVPITPPPSVWSLFLSKPPRQLMLGLHSLDHLTRLNLDVPCCEPFHGPNVGDVNVLPGLPRNLEELGLKNGGALQIESLVLMSNLKSLWLKGNLPEVQVNFSLPEHLEVFCSGLKWLVNSQVQNSVRQLTALQKLGLIRNSYPYDILLEDSCSSIISLVKSCHLPLSELHIIRTDIMGISMDHYSKACIYQQSLFKDISIKCDRC